MYLDVDTNSSMHLYYLGSRCAVARWCCRVVLLRGFSLLLLHAINGCAYMPQPPGTLSVAAQGYCA
jgi:hypothetical protein